MTFTEEADTDKKLTELATSVVNVAAAGNKSLLAIFTKSTNRMSGLTH